MIYDEDTTVEPLYYRGYYHDMNHDILLETMVIYDRLNIVPKVPLRIYVGRTPRNRQWKF